MRASKCRLRVSDERVLRVSLGTAAFFCGLICFLGCLPAGAATISVTTTADERNTNGECSLREAVINANNDNQSGSSDCGAGSGADTIVLQAGQTYTLSRDPNNGDENAADEDDLDVTTGSTVTIQGNNTLVARDFQLDCDPDGGSVAGEFRIFHVQNNAVLKLSGVAISFGCADGSGGSDPTGGGVLVAPGATLLLRNSRIEENFAMAEGGGIAAGPSSGTVRMTDSLVIGNLSQGLGGGIANGQGVILTIERSTVANNYALVVPPTNIGGGIWNNGTASIVDSTIANNAAWFGGGIYNIGQLMLLNCTLSANFSFMGMGGAILNDPSGTVTASFVTVANNAAGGGIQNNNGASGSFAVRNSIVGDNISSNCSGAVTASGVNLATDASCSSFTQVTSTQLNLGPLANYGGPTDTHALFAGSVAIDGVPLGQCMDMSNAPVAADQRGIGRPQGLRCDVGAYETLWGSAAPVPVAPLWGLAALSAGLAAFGVRRLWRPWPGK
ncbi:MAG: CSLREA domain-containing protein [Candidatus Binatia bacterium]|nr:CSLREA domain-containing protein [Candidatus Binatia bacterium]